MRIGRRFRICLSAAAFAACCCAARGTTLEQMSLARMARVAPAIVHARCVSNRTSWDEGEIWTFTTFNVLETWKAEGAAIPAQITVRLLGGTVGAITSHVSGVPRFRPGEEVILFLAPAARGDFSVTSWEQGTRSRQASATDRVSSRNSR